MLLEYLYFLLDSQFTMQDKDREEPCSIKTVKTIKTVKNQNISSEITVDIALQAKLESMNQFCYYGHLLMESIVLLYLAHQCLKIMINVLSTSSEQVKV